MKASTLVFAVSALYFIAMSSNSATTECQKPKSTRLYIYEPLLGRVICPDDDLCTEEVRSKFFERPEDVSGFAHGGRGGGVNRPLDSPYPRSPVLYSRGPRGHTYM